MKNKLPFVLLSLLIAGCSRRDATIQKELIGTWHRDADSFQVTNVIASDGSYQSQVVGLDNVTVNSSAGHLIATNGILIDTMIMNSNTNVQTPQVVQWQIVHIDKHEMVISRRNLVKTYEKVEQ